MLFLNISSSHIIGNYPRSSLHAAILIPATFCVLLEWASQVEFIEFCVQSVDDKLGWSVCFLQTFSICILCSVNVILFHYTHKIQCGKTIVLFLPLQNKVVFTNVFIFNEQTIKIMNTLTEKYKRYKIQDMKSFAASEWY